MLSDLIAMCALLARLDEAAGTHELSGTGIGPAQRRVLDLLAQNGSMTVPALARSLGQSRQSMQETVNRLDGAGLVVRSENPGHRRSALVVLTRAGGELITLLRETTAGRLDGIAARLEPGDIDTALSVVQHLCSGLTPPR